MILFYAFCFMYYGGSMELLRRIEEEKISSTCELFGSDINDIEKEIKGLIDFTYNTVDNTIDFDFFDIRGTVLLYGSPGLGKTSVMKNCMAYALERYSVDCYELLTTDIVESELGKTTKNLSEALKEFERLDKGILFIDELDRLCVDRMSDEISELKRMLIELMFYFDNLKIKDKKVLLSCTNVVDQIDKAFLRRFSILEEINKPTVDDLLDFVNICMEKASFSGKIYSLPSEILTFDDVKRTFRNAILQHKDISDFLMRR